MHFGGEQIAAALLDYHGIFVDDAQEDDVIGIVHELVERLSPHQSGYVLDGLASLVEAQQV